MNEGSFTRVQLASVELNVFDEGDGQTVLLLHGFPDTAKVWRKLVPHLIGAGLRVVAPDLRGFGHSSRPSGVSSYRLELIQQDLIELAERLGLGRIHVVGHDWGAITGWVLAARFPQLVRTLTAISVGHPRSFMKAGPDQMLRSAYAAFFQLPRVPEFALTAAGWRLFRRLVRSPDVENSIRELSDPGALTSALNWYRANLRPGRLGYLRTCPDVDVPALGILGSNDSSLGYVQMAGSSRYVGSTWELQVIEGGHWIQLTRTAEVATVLLRWLREPHG